MNASHWRTSRQWHPVNPAWSHQPPRPTILQAYLGPISNLSESPNDRHQLAVLAQLGNLCYELSFANPKFEAGCRTA
jgi:hypothetical protein